MMNGDDRRWRNQSKPWIAAFLLLTLWACRGGDIPDSMINTWVTDNPQYQKCFLTITPARIIFGDADGNREDSYIKKVSTTKQDQSVVATIDYVNSQEDSFSVELLYSGDDGGSLAFKSQPHIVWKRQESKD